MPKRKVEEIFDALREADNLENDAKETLENLKHDIEVENRKVREVKKKKIFLEKVENDANEALEDLKHDMLKAKIQLEETKKQKSSLEEEIKGAVWKWLFRHYVESPTLKTYGGNYNYGGNANILFDVNEKNEYFYKLAKFNWVTDGTWYPFRKIICIGVYAQRLYNDIECVRDEKFRTKFQEQMTDFCSLPEEEE